MAELESNVVPFEVIEEDVAAPRTGVELFVSPYASPNDVLDVVARRMNPQFLSEIQRVGGGSFDIRADDPILLDNPNLLAFRNIVRCRVDQKIVGAFVIQRKTTTIVGTGEKAAEIVKVAGEGLRTWLNDAVVYPYGGIKLRSAGERVFSFASEQGAWYTAGDWTPALKIAQYNMTPPEEGNTSPWGTAPAEWPDVPNAWWVWGRPEPAPPIGYCYFRYEFDIDVSVGTKTYATFTSGDDEFEVYVDAGRVTEAKEQYSWSKTWRADFDLDPGHHVLAARVRNTGGAGGFIAALFRVGDATADPPVEATLLTQTGDAGWLVNDYPDPAPGWSPGEVMLTLLAEASARGVRMADDLVPTFTEDRDSDGVVWPRPLDWAFDIGSSYSVVAAKLEELVCDIWIDPSNYELNMAISQGSHRDTQVVGAQPIELRIGHNLIRAEEEGIAEIKNALVMQVADGFEVHTDALSDSDALYGRLEGYLSGSSSSSVSGDVAQAVFGKYALPLTSASFKLVDRDEARPFRDFVEGDWLLAPNALGVPEPRRVMSISVGESPRTGKTEFEVEFDTILEDKEDRLERWLKTTSDGTLGGTVANSGGGGTGTPTAQASSGGPQGQTGPQGTPGFRYRQSWDTFATYKVSDVVLWDNTYWVCGVAGTTEEPSDTADDWDELVGLAAPPDGGGKYYGPWVAGAYIANSTVKHGGYLLAAKVQTSAIPQALTTVYSDNFATTPLSTRTTASSGTWTFDSTNLALQGVSSSAAVVYAMQNGMTRIRTFELDADVTLVADTLARQHLGIFLQGVDSTPVTGYRIGHIDTSWVMSKFVAGVESAVTFTALVTGAFLVGTTRHFRIVWDGVNGNGEFWVDGVKVGTWSDTSYLDLRAGFWTYQGTARFDNLVVSQYAVHPDWDRLVKTL